MSPFDGDSNTIGIQYCPGYIDKNGQWRAGFYCPPKSGGKKMYCCGTTSYKYCCSSKEETEQFGGASISYISSSTMFTVTIVTFVFAVMLTVLGFVCCRRFFKRYSGGLEIEETHSYRMTTCPGEVTATTGQEAGLTYFDTLSPSRLELTEAAILPGPTSLNGTRLDSYHLPTISSYINPVSFGFADPPPPYQVTPNPINPLLPINNSNNNNNVNNNLNNNTNSNNIATANNDRNNNRIFSLLSGPYRRDIVHPCEGQKRLWRTMSQ